jgi:hypothetical protein
LQAQTLHDVCPVSAGEFFNTLEGKVDTPVPGGWAGLADVLEVAALDDTLLALPSPGDCPGGMKGDCGALVR